MKFITSGKFNYLVPILKKTSNNPSQDDCKRLCIDLLGFFDGVMMYFGSQNIKAMPSGQDWKRIYPLFNQDEIPYVYTSVGYFRDQDIKSLIQSVARSKFPIAVSISNNQIYGLHSGHRVAMAKYSDTKVLFVR